MTIKTACIAATGGFDQSALAAGRSLRPVIDRHFPLDELAAAFRHQESGQHFGKIAIDIRRPRPQRPARW